MSNLTGDPFAPWVKKQVDLRQKALGQYSNISSQDLQYYTTKTPFLRLASSVNLTNIGPTVDGKPSILEDSILKKLVQHLGISESSIAGAELAKKFILQGGVVSSTGENTSPGLQKGLNDGNTLSNGSYGWGGTQERGFVPMPGITDASVQYYGNGSLSRTQINVRLFSKAQFALFDVLYLRPGYTLLMEFGWSQYLDNDTGKLVSMDQFHTEPLSLLLNAPGKDPKGPTNQYKIYKSIKREKQKHSGNYEAAFGKISKFSWKFNSDGSYDCQIQLTSMGDIIESLKVNITDPNALKQEGVLKGKWWNYGATKIDSSEDEGTETPTSPPLIANASKTIINTQLFGIYQSCLDSGGEGWSDYIVPALVEVEESGNTPERQDFIIPKGLFTVTGTTTDDEENQSPQVFIKYGAFLAFCQSKLLLYSSKECSPIFSFAMNFKDLDNDENVILKIPGGFSSNPNICLIPYTDYVSANQLTTDPPLGIPQSPINEKLAESTSWEYSTYLGRISQILVNINYIAKVLDSAKSEDGDINLLDFLKSINSGIIESLGNINAFEIKLGDDDDQNKILFIEDIPQRREPPLAPTLSYTRFNVYGVKPGVEGSFVKNLDFTSDLSDNMATMISVGAQANSNQISANAVSFSNYSAGLIDRISEDKLTITAAEITKPTDGDVPETIKSNFDKNINPTENSLFDAVYGGTQWTNENVSSLVSHNKTHAALILGDLTTQKEGGAQLPAPFFLPFNLNLEIEGLSGMRLRQKFLMTDDILPISYAKDGVDLQVRGINHLITPQSWTTKLDSLSTPAAKLAEVSRPPQMSSTTQAAGGGSTTGGSSKATTGGGSVGAIGDLQTITSKYPMAKIFYDEVTPKKQIVIHHTAGGQSIANEIRGWSTRTDRVSTHYITNNSGEKEQVFPDENWSNNLGVKSSTFRKLGLTYQNLNRTSLSIEMQAFGGLTLKDGIYRTYVNSKIPPERVARPVDKNGNFISYKGYKYYEKYSDANIQRVKEIVQGWKNKYGIPFTYNYDELFPSSNSLSIKALKGESGIYTHNSFRTGKSDVFPQAELIAMLKSLSSGSSGGNTSTSSTFIYNPQKASESITPPTNTLQAGDIVTVTINYNDGENIGTGVGTATVQSLSRRDVAIRSARLKAKGSLTDQFSN